jgi:GMP synthase (glutamine-hydrolysing)
MILIVDFGSQTAHLIGRRLRQLGVATEYTYPEDALNAIHKFKPVGIILSGGPASVYEKNAPTLNPKVYESNIPILGICYGQQLTAHLLGGNVKPGAIKEYGPAMLELNSASPLLHGIGDNHFRVWMSHGDEVVIPPAGFSIIATTTNIKAAMIQDLKRNIYCVQFHPEVDHTTNGQQILRNFVEIICKETLSPLVLSPEKIIKEIIQMVGDKQVICAVSGGVDSTVAAFLIGKAIGDNLIPVYVESGLMRPNTDEKVKMIFTKLIRSKLVIVDARARFLTVLVGIVDPEIKRKTIGKLYVDIFQEEAVKRTNVAFLGQGTIYSDVIESKGSKHASHIKSHHNVGGLPKDMHLALLEPLREYYKDEVRALGKMAGLPDEITLQEPMPGPGYAVRIRGEVTRGRLEQVKIADTIVVEEIKKAGIYHRLFHCFALMTGAFSTAVKGDGRVFAEVVGLRMIESKDIMTSTWADIPHDVLAKISSRIVNEVPNVSRVVYDITTKPPATMEWE